MVNLKVIFGAAVVLGGGGGGAVEVEGGGGGAAVDEGGGGGAAVVEAGGLAVVEAGGAEVVGVLAQETTMVTISTAITRNAMRPEYRFIIYLLKILISNRSPAIVLHILEVIWPSTFKFGLFAYHLQFTKLLISNLLPKNLLVKRYRR